MLTLRLYMAACFALMLIPLISAGEAAVCKGCKKSQHKGVAPQKIKGPVGKRCPQFNGGIATEVARQWKELKAKGIPAMRSCSQDRYVDMFSNLFFHESTCNPQILHHKYMCRKNGKKYTSPTKKAGCWVFNPHPGYGLCALETSAALRKARGPDCSDIKSVAGQIRCCVSIVKNTGRGYFGTMHSGKVRTACK